MRTIALLTLACLMSCARSQGPSTLRTEGDESIVFPHFFESPAVIVGERDKVYSLDGVMLRALMIAFNDAFPPGAEELPCPARPEAHGFRAIRQGDIIFVYIHVDPAHCGRQFLVLDGGVKYAIGSDGRILRRVVDGDPAEEAVSPIELDAGALRGSSEPGFSTILKPPGHDPAPYLPPNKQDGGSASDGGVSGRTDRGVPPILDGGT